MANETPAPLSDAEIRESAERAEKATPGPWYPESGIGEFVQQSSSHMAICRVNNPVVNDWRRRITVDGGPGSNQANKEFIAHARTDIPRLIATLAARDAELAALREREAAEREIVAAVADGVTVSYDAGVQLYCCSDCGRQVDGEDIDAALAIMIHKPRCITERARALLDTTPADANATAQEGE